MILQVILSNIRFTFNDRLFEQVKRLAMKVANLRICLFARDVDNVFIMTKDNIIIIIIIIISALFAVQVEGQ